MGPWELLLIFVLLPAGIAYTIGRSRDQGGWGLLLGLLLSWLGVIITLFLPAGGVRCPACKERIKHGAVRCRFCASTLEYYKDGRKTFIRAYPPA